MSTDVTNHNKLKERLRESKVKHRNNYDRDDYTPMFIPVWCPDGTKLQITNEKIIHAKSSPTPIFNNVL